MRRTASRTSTDMVNATVGVALSEVCCQFSGTWTWLDSTLESKARPENCFGTPSQHGQKDVLEALQHSACSGAESVSFRSHFWLLLLADLTYFVANTIYLYMAGALARQELCYVNCCQQNLHLHGPLPGPHDLLSILCCKSLLLLLTYALSAPDQHSFTKLRISSTGCFDRIDNACQWRVSKSFCTEASPTPPVRCQLAVHW